MFSVQRFSKSQSPSPVDTVTADALEKVIEKLHQAWFKVPALPKHCYAGPGYVACDLCTEKQLKAVKSCLTCTASYCESHVRHHYTVAALQRHTLVEVTGNLEQKLCQLHHKALEVFCKTDQVSSCITVFKTATTFLYHIVYSVLTASLLTEDLFSCSVCTEVLKKPVSVPCGHSYCRRCIETYWNQTGDYYCPQCRKRFRTRPDLLTNSSLEKVIEKLHQAWFKVPALPKHCYAGPADVACDLCTEKQLKAVKSCLTCTASYCESHVRHHYTVAALQRHTLVEVTGNLEQKLCQLHHRALEVFCKTDQVSVCLVCALQNHMNHDVIKNERDTEEENTKTQEEQIASRLEARLQREIMILQHNTEELPAENSEQVPFSVNTLPSGHYW
ncbi:E3 ubiquitin-protein ligase TRIM47-like [Oncorhynchus tshawytscha]|uniref:E3 ubiquitin-protein ligase TRIM47-like n=1 Tax=Oncorhynchus tshawytscha TaxID=74940 RepID=UPI001C3E3E9D|nr:E3 ubiquitin-protein ligase TRIM47-like [Oncorhynchus tshawytscha]